jgi:hypothetical protein
VSKLVVGKDFLSEYQLDISGNFHASGSVFIDGSLSFKNQQITGIATPINSSDAANKYFVTAYVDGSLAASNASMGIYATNASIASAAFAKSVSFNSYSTTVIIQYPSACV